MNGDGDNVPSDSFVLSGNVNIIPDVPSESKPRIGMCFPSLNHACEFYDTYAKLAGFAVRKGGQWAPDGSVKTKYLLCSKEGKKPVKRFDSLDDLNMVNQGKKSRKRPSIRTGCPALIGVSSENGQEFKVYKFIEEHNHDLLSDEDIHFIPNYRQLSFNQEQMLCQLSNVNLGPVKSFNVMRQKYGGFENVGATAADFKNFRKDMNKFVGEYDADMIIQRLEDKKKYLEDFSFEYSSDENGRLTGLFWADGLMKKNYFEFGDVISFDATFDTNKYKMVFVPFTGIDNHFRNVTIAAGLLASETIESYKWLLMSFLKAFGRQPKVVVTDQDPAMKQAIEVVFNETRHRLCMWHIMKKVAAKVGAALCNDENFKTSICSIVWTDSISPAEFEEQWVKIMDEFGIADNDWIKDMFELRRMWIPAFYRDEPLSGLMRTTSRSESENHFFGQVSNSQLTLVEFFNHFETAMESQRYTHRKNDHDTRYTNPDLWTPLVMEAQAAQIYTRTIFYDVQEEIMASYNDNITFRVKKKPDGWLMASIKDFHAFGDGFLEVMFKKSDDVSVSCSCKRYEQYGLLCRHIFLVLRMFKVQEFPRNYICNRWRREVVPNHPTSYFVVQDESNPDGQKANHIAREIMQLGEKLVDCLISDVDKLSLARDQIQSLVSNANDGRFKRPVSSKRDRFATVLGYKQPSEVTVRVPTGIRNKGRGSHKRLKSKKEQAISRLGKRGRKCLVCFSSGHDRRTCPVLKGSKEQPNNSKDISGEHENMAGEDEEDEEDVDIDVEIENFEDFLSDCEDVDA